MVGKNRSYCTVCIRKPLEWPKQIVVTSDCCSEQIAAMMWEMHLVAISSMKQVSVPKRYIPENKSNNRQWWIITFVVQYLFPQKCILNNSFRGIDANKPGPVQQGCQKMPTARLLEDRCNLDTSPGGTNRREQSSMRRSCIHSCSGIASSQVQEQPWRQEFCHKRMHNIPKVERSLHYE